MEKQIALVASYAPAGQMTYVCGCDILSKYSRDKSLPRKHICYVKIPVVKSQSYQDVVVLKEHNFKPVYLYWVNEVAEVSVDVKSKLLTKNEQRLADDFISYMRMLSPISPIKAYSTLCLKGDVYSLACYGECLGGRSVVKISPQRIHPDTPEYFAFYKAAQEALKMLPEVRKAFYIQQTVFITLSPRRQLKYKIKKLKDF